MAADVRGKRGEGGGAGREADDGLHEIEEEEPPRGEARRKALAAALQQVFAPGADRERARRAGCCEGTKKRCRGAWSVASSAGTQAQC